MSIFRTQIENETAMGRTDLNKVSENILIPILAEVYGYKNLRNLNAELENYPGIDLEGELFIGDEITKVAFQITATPNTKKIKKTLKKFVDYNLYKKYDRLIIYILVEKQKSYSGKGYDEIIQSKFTFDKDKDILDYRDILKEISNFPIERCHKIEKILEANFGKLNISSFQPKPSSRNESVYLNLLELSFPTKIYVAQLDINREKIIKQSWSEEYKIKLKNNSSTRNVVKAAIEQQKLNLGSDYKCYEGNLITFHNLTDNNSPLLNLVDRQTIKTYNSRDFYEIDENYNRVFKSLLGHCLQEKLRHQQVYWQHQVKLFIFSGVNGQPKREEKWKRKKKSERTVYEQVYKKKNPEEISHHKHLAFSTQYIRFGQNWYLLIKPTWFFSFNGYKKSFYSKDRLDWIKKQERNKQVGNHLHFIIDFLKSEVSSDLFISRQAYPYLSFGNLVDFDCAPALEDSEWLPKKAQEENRQNNLEQLALDLDV